MANPRLQVEKASKKAGQRNFAFGKVHQEADDELKRKAEEAKKADFLKESSADIARELAKEEVEFFGDQFCA